MSVDKLSVHDVICCGSFGITSLRSSRNGGRPKWFACDFRSFFASLFTENRSQGSGRRWELATSFKAFPKWVGELWKKWNSFEYSLDPLAWQVRKFDRNRSFDSSVASYVYDLIISRYIRGATAAEYAANLRNVYKVHTIQVREIKFLNFHTCIWTNTTSNCQALNTDNACTSVRLFTIFVSWTDWEIKPILVFRSTIKFVFSPRR